MAFFFFKQIKLTKRTISDYRTLYRNEPFMFDISISNSRFFYKSLISRKKIFLESSQGINSRRKKTNTVFYIAQNSLYLCSFFETNIKMTPTEVALKEKESAILQSFSGIFPSIDTFYATCYLIIRNGHQWEQEKSDMWEEKCETVAWFRHKIERILTQNGLPGEDIVADIASDYFEDYVHYIDRTFDISNDEYINYIKQLQLI